MTVIHEIALPDGRSIALGTAPVPDGERGTRRERERQTVSDIIADMTGSRLELGHDADGAPLLDGHHISVTHTAGLAAVALADFDIGIDAEAAVERARLTVRRVTVDGDDPDLDGHVRWMVKEAVFKAARRPRLTLVDIAVGADGTAAADNRRFAWLLVDRIVVAYEFG